MADGDEFSKLFANKQVSVGLMWSGQSATMKQDGQPIGFVVPEDGAIGWVDNWAIAKSSENKELAYAFINYMIGKDVQYGLGVEGRSFSCQSGGCGRDRSGVRGFLRDG